MKQKIQNQNCWIEKHDDWKQKNKVPHPIAPTKPKPIASAAPHPISPTPTSLLSSVVSALCFHSLMMSPRSLVTLEAYGESKIGKFMKQKSRWLTAHYGGSKRQFWIKRNNKKHKVLKSYESMRRKVGRVEGKWGGWRGNSFYREPKNKKKPKQKNKNAITEIFQTK